MLTQPEQNFVSGIYLASLSRRNKSLDSGSKKKMNISFLRHRRNERQFSKPMTEDAYRKRITTIEKLVQSKLIRVRPIDARAEVPSHFGTKKKVEYKYRLSLTKEGVELAKNLLMFEQV